MTLLLEPVEDIWEERTVEFVFDGRSQYQPELSSREDSALIVIRWGEIV